MTLDLKFKYDNFWRQVSNVTFEPETRTVIGFEMRKSGKFSYRIKRYALDNMTDISFIEPLLRSGPKIGLP
jgi:hypothetical protein